MSIRKFAVLAVTAVLVAVVLPAAPASAATSRGYNIGCYGIKKKGNYNSVRLAAVALESGTKLAAVGSIGVSASCQRVNSLPVIHMTISAVALYVNGRRVAGTGRVSNGGTKGYIKAATGYVTVPCGSKASVHMAVTYDYYDHSTVRPFVFGSQQFRHC